MPELQIDGLPGPTAFHGGLSPGNLASEGHAGAESHPRAGARQCLAKMRLVARLGVPQTMLPPLPRPDLGFLRSLGFAGDDASVLSAAVAAAPRLVALAMSSSFMWTANAATAIPGHEATDGVTRLIIANLAAMPHRSLEPASRTAQLRRLFASTGVEIVAPLPAMPALGDEGAANHHRAATSTGHCHVFVHGRALATPAKDQPRQHTARQTREASEAVARLGRVDGALHVRQLPTAIDAGVFHNDVVCTGSRDRLLIHEQAWVDQEETLAELGRRVPGLKIRVVRSDELSLAEAVASYLFNGQLLRTKQHGQVLILPGECRNGRAGALAEKLVGEGFIDRVEHVDLRSSMMNGGGPACLRLRVPLTAEQVARLPPASLLDEQRIDTLEAIVDSLYPERLIVKDLADPDLLKASAAAIEAFNRVLGWPG